MADKDYKESDFWAQKKMKAFLHASKSKLYLHFVHQRAGLPSFQDFDFTHEFRHYMLCFL